MNNFILTVIVCFPLFLFSQDCDCKSNFNWVKATFEKNDAGYDYAIDTKGEKAYEKHNQIFSQRIANIIDYNECVNAIYEWLTFFRSGHISIRNLEQDSNQNGSNQLSDEDIIQQYKDAESLDIDIEEFKQYLASKKKADYEGIWLSDPYKIGIKKIDNDYFGFIIEADGVYWTEGQVKLKILSDNTMEYAMRDHSIEVLSNTQLLGNNHIISSFITLKRIEPKYESIPKIESYFKSISASKPYFEKINDKTVYLRIPSFSATEKADIDQVILSNKELILQTPNLIIDIQNNGGGSDMSFDELVPIFYTNPIRTMAVEFLSTPLNNQRMLDFISKPEWGFDEEGKIWAQHSYEKLNEAIGSFVNLDTNMVSITTYDTIYPYPKNIAIVINENNGSTAEQFLLSAKQSKKVKLYGATTAGVLDISNMYFVPSPCAEFELGYCLTKSKRIPAMAIDGKGIQPDFFIDETIHKYDWIEYVTKSISR